MDFKRILTSVIGLPLVILILVFGNIYVFDILMMVIAIICITEYFIVIEKVAHPIKIIGYLSTLIIALASVLSVDMVATVILYSIPVILLLLFSKVIVTNMKTTFKDVAYTFLGIFYITIFIMFLSLIRGLPYGKIIFGYTLVIAWCTDIFAYLAGKKLGKHHFSEVSPKKTIEGCIGGILGAVVFSLIYVYIVNECYASSLDLVSYIYIAIISVVLSVISQIGDFTASSIKRFADTKDYGHLLPGHGGMLDRIDSLIFIAPFVYWIANLL